MKGELDDEAATIYEEFEEEAVRLVATSGRTQRAVAEDLGIGRSTLVPFPIEMLRWVTRLPRCADGARSAI